MQPWRQEIQDQRYFTYQGGNPTPQMNYQGYSRTMNLGQDESELTKVQQYRGMSSTGQDFYKYGYDRPVMDVPEMERYSQDVEENVGIPQNYLAWQQKMQPENYQETKEKSEDDETSEDENEDEEESEEESENSEQSSSESNEQRQSPERDPRIESKTDAKIKSSQSKIQRKPPKGGYDPLLSLKNIGEIKDVKFQMSCMKREIEGLCKMMKNLTITKTAAKSNRHRDNSQKAPKKSKTGKSKSPNYKRKAPIDFNQNLNQVVQSRGLDHVDVKLMTTNNTGARFDSLEASKISHQTFEDPANLQRRPQDTKLNAPESLEDFKPSFGSKNRELNSNYPPTDQQSFTSSNTKSHRREKFEEFRDAYFKNERAKVGRGQTSHQLYSTHQTSSNTSALHLEKKFLRN